MILLDVFDHVRDGQWERNQKMGYTNSQRIDKCSEIHIHVRQDVKKGTGVGRMIKTKKAPKPCVTLQRFLPKAE